MACSMHKRDGKCIPNFSQTKWKRQTGRSRLGWVDAMKMDFETGCEDVD
jgi:hypothetical protein